MSESSIQVALSPPTGPAAPPRPPSRPREDLQSLGKAVLWALTSRQWSVCLYALYLFLTLFGKKILRPLASLRLTVFLFALSMILVFCGTLAMMDQGLFTVLSRYFRSGIAWIPFQTFVRFGQVFFGVPPNTQLTGSFPFPGGWTIGAVLLVNLLAAHIMRFRFTWKRSGILMLHAGLIILMLGELVTGLFAVESSMTIPVGGSSNYIENFDRLELAFVWPADANNDNVVVVPDNLLHQGSIIRHEELPVDIEVKRYLGNSTLSDDVPPAGENLATRGFGLGTAAIEQPPGRGVDAEQKRDMPSAYLTFKDKESGASLGTYLVSLLLKEQDVEIDGKTYQLALRLRRSYRPFTFELKELRHENYQGTILAKRYASLVHVTNPSRGEDREVLIHMNHPFYYEGETFYQSNVNSDKRTGLEYTGLQVVRNPGWPLPYIACTLVIVGMAVHFVLHLLGFFRRMVTQ